MRSYPRPSRRHATATLSAGTTAVTTAGTTGTLAAHRRASNLSGTAGPRFYEVAHG